MPQSLLDQLPQHLAFLAPCAREMLAFRGAQYRPSVDPREYPEQAFADEVAQCSPEYERILGRCLINEVFSGSSDLFSERVAAIRRALLAWIEPVRTDVENPEVRILLVIIGSLGYPETYLEMQRSG